MKENRKKEPKGISLLALTITILVMGVITSTLVYNAKDGIEIRRYKNLENDILDLGTKLIPLATSYTQSNNAGGKVGAPEKELTEKAPKTIQNEESLDR